MTIPNPVPVNPYEADRTKIARLDFAPTCDFYDEDGSCVQRASRAVQCTNCQGIVAWFCMSHSAELEDFPDKDSRCDLCGEVDDLHNLAALVSLAGWF